MFEIEIRQRSNIDPRRMVELRDARLIQEDHNAIANLSPVPIHREVRTHTPFYSHIIDVGF